MAGMLCDRQTQLVSRALSELSWCAVQAPLLCLCALESVAEFRSVRQTPLSSVRFSVQPSSDFVCVALMCDRLKCCCCAGGAAQPSTVCASERAATDWIGAREQGPGRGASGARVRSTLEDAAGRDRRRAS